MTRDKTYRNDLGLRETMIFSESSSTLPLDEFLLIQRHVNLDGKELIRMKRLICIGKS
jgi:hypothetical protein